MVHYMCPQTCLFVGEIRNQNSFILTFFAFQVAVSFSVITLSIEFQISHPGIVLKTREQELSFGTKIYGILGLADGDISYQSFDQSSTSHQVKVVIQIAVSFPVITLSIEFQIWHPGIVLETREQELSFGTKIFGILGLTNGDISSQSFDWSSTSPTVEVTQNTDYGPERRVAYLASGDDLFISEVFM